MNQIITYRKILIVYCIHYVLLNWLQAIPASRLINYTIKGTQQCHRFVPQGDGAILLFKTSQQIIQIEFPVLPKFKFLSDSESDSDLGEIVETVSHRPMVNSYMAYVYDNN